jgi:hypothetical protein
MKTEIEGLSHILVMIDSGSLITRIKAISCTNETADISSGLADFMSLQGIYRNFYGKDFDFGHDIITSAFDLIQLPASYDLQMDIRDTRLLNLTGQMAVGIIESYMFSADADKYDWIDTIYWAMYALNVSIRYNQEHQAVSRTMHTVALRDIKSSFTLLTSDLFSISEHRIFPNYPQQLFVKLYIDFNLTELGIVDWQPLTPRLESSHAFQLYSNTSAKVRQWIAERDRTRSST